MQISSYWNPSKEQWETELARESEELVKEDNEFISKQNKRLIEPTKKTDNQLFSRFLIPQYRDREKQLSLWRIVKSSSMRPFSCAAAANAIQILKALGFSFSGLDLPKIQIQKADLSEAIFSYCNLSGACLEGVKLAHADLTHTNFKKASLTGIEWGQDPLETGELIKRCHFSRDDDFVLVSLNENNQYKLRKYPVKTGINPLNVSLSSFFQNGVVENKSCQRILHSFPENKNHYLCIYEDLKTGEFYFVKTDKNGAKNGSQNNDDNHTSKVFSLSPCQNYLAFLNNNLETIEVYCIESENIIMKAKLPDASLDEGRFAVKDSRLAVSENYLALAYREKIWVWLLCKKDPSNQASICFSLYSPLSDQTRFMIKGSMLFIKHKTTIEEKSLASDDSSNLIDSPEPLIAFDISGDERFLAFTTGTKLFFRERGKQDNGQTIELDLSIQELLFSPNGKNLVGYSIHSLYTWEVCGTRLRLLWRIPKHLSCCEADFSGSSHSLSETDKSRLKDKGAKNID